MSVAIQQPVISNPKEDRGVEAPKISNPKENRGVEASKNVPSVLQKQRESEVNTIPELISRILELRINFRNQMYDQKSTLGALQVFKAFESIVNMIDSRKLGLDDKKWHGYKMAVATIASGVFGVAGTLVGLNMANDMISFAGRSLGEVFKGGIEFFGAQDEYSAGEKNLTGDFYNLLSENWKAGANATEDITHSNASAIGQAILALMTAAIEMLRAVNVR